MDPELLSRREAAELAGVHTNTVLAWERNGLIQVKRVRVKGKQETRIPRGEIERMVGPARRSRTGDEQRPESRIARRLRLGRERGAAREPTRAPGPGDDAFRRERQTSARALRRERDALAQAEADRAAR